MKKLRNVSGSLLILLWVIHPVICFAQQVQYSASTQLFLERLEDYKRLKPGSQKEIYELQKEFGVITNRGKVVVGAILKVNDDLDLKKLKKLGIEINIRAGNLLSVKIPVYKFKKLKKVKGVLLVDVDIKGKVRD